MNTPSPRPPPRAAAPELLVLQHAEDLATFVLQRTPRWPKSTRFVLQRRIEELCLLTVEEIVAARYQARERLARLDAVNLQLERARFVLRIAAAARICPANHYEAIATRIDTIGRMLFGWRQRLRGAHA